jgi:hypothetical protein
MTFVHLFTGIGEPIRRPISTKGNDDMTSTKTPVEPANVRALTEAEIGDVTGGAISLGTWLRRLAWQIENAPANSTLVGCSDDMSSCSWQSN